MPQNERWDEIPFCDYMNLVDDALEELGAEATSQDELDIVDVAQLANTPPADLAAELAEYRNTNMGAEHV